MPINFTKILNSRNLGQAGITFPVGTPGLGGRAPFPPGSAPGTPPGGFPANAPLGQPTPPSGFSPSNLGTGSSQDFTRVLERGDDLAQQYQQTDNYLRGLGQKGIGPYKNLKPPIGANMLAGIMSALYKYIPPAALAATTIKALEAITSEAQDLNAQQITQEPAGREIVPPAGIFQSSIERLEKGEGSEAAESIGRATSVEQPRRVLGASSTTEAAKEIQVNIDKNVTALQNTIDKKTNKLLNKIPPVEIEALRRLPKEFANVSLGLINSIKDVGIDVAEFGYQALLEPIKDTFMRILDRQVEKSIEKYRGRSSIKDYLKKSGF